MNILPVPIILFNIRNTAPVTPIFPASDPAYGLPSWLNILLAASLSTGSSVELAMGCLELRASVMPTACWEELCDAACEGAQQLGCRKLLLCQLRGIRLGFGYGRKSRFAELGENSCLSMMAAQTDDGVLC